MARRRRTPEEAIEQSEHVLYEIQMLGALRLHFLLGDHDQVVAALPLKGLASRNALVEAFQIHARQLIDFLTDQGGRREATATDFVAGDWSVEAKDRKTLKKLSGEFSERVAHLSWQRSQHTAEQQRVMTEDIFDAIRRHLLDFVTQIDSDRVRPEFVEDAIKALFVDTTEPGLQHDSMFNVNPAVLRATTFTGGTATGALQPPGKPDERDRK